MNVKDFEHVEIPEGDMLSGIFAGQTELMNKYHDIEKDRGFIVIDEPQYGDLDHRFVQYRIKDLNARAVEELYEAMNTLKNKPWKQSEVPTDALHFYEEVGDALHFFVEMCITAGMTAEDLARIYHRKHAVNEFRQRSNY
jgi:hypothetical protein